MSRLFLSVALIVASILSLAAAQSISFSQVTTNAAFPPREYAACAQTPAASGSTPTLYFFGGLSVTLIGNSTNIATTGNSYNDSYFNDAWSSTNFGGSWNQLNGNANFPAQGWNGAVRTNNGNLVYIGGGGDSNSGQNNQIWTSSNGITFSSTTGPWQARENAGIAGIAGTNSILVALGNTGNNESVDDIWYSSDAGATWNQTCHYTSCPFVSSVNSAQVAGQVHGPAAVGLTTGYFVLIGGYGNDPSATGTTTWVTNQVAVSNNAFVTWTTYTAPWSPRAQMRATVDADNFVYVYGGVYNLPLSGSGTSYTSVPSQAYYGYFSDIFYSTNAVAGNWVQLSVSGLGSASYPGQSYSYSSNPNSNVIPTSFYTNGAIFNPCLAVGYTSTGAKQLALYTGLFAGYRQNQVVGVNVQYPGVYSGTVNFGSSSSSSGGNGATTSSSTGGNGATMVSASVISVVVAAVVAMVAHML